MALTSSPLRSTPARDAPPGVIVAVLAFAGICAAMTQTLVIPLLGELPTLLRTNSANASWVVTATLLSGSVATPVSGRLGDLYGKRRVMLICALILTAGSVLCALAASAIPMIVGRALQGVGMGLVPLGISAMRDLIPAEKLGSAIALMSASLGIGGALGLPLAATAAQNLDWRFLFWAGATAAAAVFVLILVFIPHTPVSAQGRFDFVGALAFGAGLTCLLLGISKGSDWGWDSGRTLACLIAAPIILAVWGWFELRTKHPLVELRIASRPVVLLTNAASVVIGFALYAQSLIVPQVMQLPEATGPGLGQSMIQMGLWMLPGGLAMMLFAPIGARLSHARGPRTTLAAGAAIMSIGYLTCLLLLNSASGLMIAVVVTNAGVGFAYGAMPALIMGSVPTSETGSANSFNSLMRSIGTTVAAAVVGVILSQMTIDVGGRAFPTEDGFRTGLWIGAGMALLGSLIALTIPVKASQQAEDSIEHGR